MMNGRFLSEAAVFLCNQATMSVGWPPMRHLLSLLLFVVICAGCKKAPQTATGQAPSPVQQKGLQQTGPANPKIAACKLITTEEVGAIQGAKITDTKSSAGWSGNLLMSQCYYAAMEPNKSVSL